MFDKMIEEIKKKIPDYECVLDIVVENPVVGKFPFYDKKMPVFRIIGSCQPFVFLVAANKQFEKAGWRQAGGNDTYDYYKVVVDEGEIKSITRS